MVELKFDRKNMAIVLSPAEAIMANTAWATLTKMKFFEYYPHRMETSIRIICSHPFFYKTTILRAKKIVVDIMARHIKTYTPKLLKQFMREFDEVMDEDFNLKEIITTSRTEYNYFFFCVNWNALWMLVAGGNGGKIRVKRK